MDLNKYNISADIIRIIAGFGVVLIHVTDPFIVYPPLYGLRGFSWEIIQMINSLFRMSVPLFIMLSGYLLLNNPENVHANNFYQKRLKRILLPFIFWLIIHFGWLQYEEGNVSIWSLLSDIVRVNIHHLYFIVVIASLYLMTPIFMAYINQATMVARKALPAIAVFAVAFLTASGFIIPKAIVTTGNNIITISLPFMAYYLAGYYGFGNNKARCSQ